MHKLIFIFICFVSEVCLVNGEVTWTQSTPAGFIAKAVISTNRATPSEAFKIDLWLTYPENYLIELDALKTNLLKHSPLALAPFTLIDSSIVATNKSKNSITQQIVFTLQPNLTGYFPLTFYDIRFLPKTDIENIVILISEIFHIQVALPLFDTNPLLALSQELPITINSTNLQNMQNEVKKEAIRNVQIAQQAALPWISIVSLTVGTVLLLFLRKIREKRAHPPLTLEEQVKLARQKALKALNMLQVTPSKQFYVELTNTVRKYIEECFHVNAPTQTTQEFLHAAATYSAFDSAVRLKLENFLAKADYAKFAHYQPSTEECLEAKRLAESFVIETS